MLVTGETEAVVGLVGAAAEVTGGSGEVGDGADVTNAAAACSGLAVDG